MKRYTLSACLLMLSTMAFAQPRGGDDAVRQALIRLDRDLAKAEASGDTAAIERILATDYTLTDITGRVGDRAHSLEVVKAAHRDTVSTDGYDVRVYGDTAVMTHRAVMKAPDGGSEQLRATHVWVRRNGAWQIVADHCSAVQYPQLGSKPFLNAACSDASFEPEAVQLFGDGETVARKLQSAEMHIKARRTYVLLIETSTAAEVTVFERQGDGSNVRLIRWSGKSLGDLRERLSTLMLANRGLACIGQQSKALVKASFNTTDLGTIPAPMSAAAAFTHRVRGYGANYMRATVLLLC